MSQNGGHQYNFCLKSHKHPLSAYKICIYKMTQKELVLLRSRLIKEVIKDRRKKEKTK
jgi:hypothetical protein